METNLATRCALAFLALAPALSPFIAERSPADGLLVASSVEVGSQDSADFLEGWFEELGFASEARKLLHEHDQQLWGLLREHQLGLSDVRKGLHSNVVSRAVVRDELLDELIERLEALRADYQEEGDTKSFKLRDLIAGLRAGEAPPLPLHVGYEEGEGERSGVETVTFDGHEYALIDRVVSWWEAQDICAEMGGYLACVETREELEFLGGELLSSKGSHGGERLDALNTMNIFWVGASDSSREGDWRWVSGDKVDGELFRGDGDPPQPSNFNWGEHHAGLVRHQDPAAPTGELKLGFVSWFGSTGCRGAICEWGRTPLPEEWAFLTQREEERVLAPYWKALSRQEEREEAADSKAVKRSRSSLKKMEKFFREGVVERRNDLLKVFRGFRKTAIKGGFEEEAMELDVLISAVGISAFDPQAQAFSRDGLEMLPGVTARAFGKTYVYVTEGMVVGDAEAYCARLGGHLPHPAHDLELSLLANVINRVGGKASTWLSRSFSAQWRAGQVDESLWPSLKFPTPYKGGMHYPGLYIKPGAEELGAVTLEKRRPFVCVIEGYVPPVHWTELQVEGVDAGLRGLSVVDAESAWCGGGDGTLLRTTDGGVTWEPRPVPGGEELDFRSISAQDVDTVWVASAGEGELSRIYHTQDGGLNWSLQRTNKEPKGFYDSIAFWDKQRGLVLGDQVGGRLTILRTEDGGASWARVSAEEQPPSPEGEYAFAASGTSIALASKRHAWMGTGGSTSRVFTSDTAGKTWAVSRPLSIGDDGIESSGIFSLATLDGRRGLAVGGDYKEPGQATTHFARTEDGGRTWRSPSVAANASPAGFRSCVAADPSADQRAWIAVGTEGADVSLDGGLTWQAAGEVSLNSVGFAPKGGVGFAVGPDGVIMRFELVE